MKTRQAVIGTLVALATITAGYVTYLLSTYEDRVIEVGEGYGFTIGQDKGGAFASASAAFTGRAVYILWPLDKNHFGPHHRMSFGDEDFARISDRDVWEFYLDNGYSNIVRLTFCSRVLCSIYRHRQELEFP